MAIGAARQRLRGRGRGDLDRARAEEAVANRRSQAEDRRQRRRACASGSTSRPSASGFPGLPPLASPTISLFSLGATVSYGLDLFGLTRRRIEVAGAAVDAEAPPRRRRLSGAHGQRRASGGQDRRSARGARRPERHRRRRPRRHRHRPRRPGRRRSRTPRAWAARPSFEADQAMAPAGRGRNWPARGTTSPVWSDQPPSTWTAPDFAFQPSHRRRRSPSPCRRPRPQPAGHPRRGGRPPRRYREDRGGDGEPLSEHQPRRRPDAGSPDARLDLLARTRRPTTSAPRSPPRSFHGGALRAERRAAEAQARASMARYRQTVSRAFVQVADVLTALRGRRQTPRRRRGAGRHAPGRPGRRRRRRTASGASLAPTSWSPGAASIRRAWPASKPRASGWRTS